MMRRGVVLHGPMPRASGAHAGRWGNRASEEASRQEGMAMVNNGVHWRQPTALNKAAWFGWTPFQSHVYPKGMRGKGIEYRKFEGEEQTITPAYMGGPQEAVHDENRNRVFHNDMAFPDFPNAARHLNVHITTRPRSHYKVNMFSGPAIKAIAQNAYEASQRRLIWNPHVPTQPVEGPSDIPSNELETLRKQAFLAGVEFPEFPDVKPVEQRDPWEEQDDQYQVPAVDNDKLLDADMWQQVHQNMQGMEAKVRAFKDGERKKLFAWKQARLTNDLKRARQELSHIKAQEGHLSRKTTVETQQRRIVQRMKRSGVDVTKLSPWERRRMINMQKAAADEEEPESDEDQDDFEQVTLLQKKERRRVQRAVLGQVPRGERS